MATTSPLALLFAALFAASYAQTGFTFTGTEYKCEGDESCAGVTDAQLVESLQCKGFCACCGADFEFACAVDKCHIECEQEDSCAALVIAMDGVESVSCGESRACAEAVFMLEVVAGATFECSDEEACMFGDYTLMMNSADLLQDGHLDELQCHGEGSCASASFVSERVEKLSCDGYGACYGGYFFVTNPARDFSLQCEGGNACRYALFEIVYTADAPDLYMKSIECESSEACKETNIIIENDSTATVVIDELKCEGFQACSELNIAVTGSVQINRCVCTEPEGYGCLCTSGLDAICNEFEGVWTSSSAIYACV